MSGDFCRVEWELSAAQFPLHTSVVGVVGGDGRTQPRLLFSGLDEELQKLLLRAGFQRSVPPTAPWDLRSYQFASERGALFVLGDEREERQPTIAVLFRGVEREPEQRSAELEDLSLRGVPCFLDPRDRSQPAPETSCLPSMNRLAIEALLRASRGYRLAMAAAEMRVQMLAEADVGEFAKRTGRRFIVLFWGFGTDVSGEGLIGRWRALRTRALGAEIGVCWSPDALPTLHRLLPGLVAGGEGEVLEVEAGTLLRTYSRDGSRWWP